MRKKILFLRALTRAMFTGLALIVLFEITGCKQKAKLNEDKSSKEKNVEKLVENKQGSSLGSGGVVPPTGVPSSGDGAGGGNSPTPPPGSTPPGGEAPAPMPPSPPEEENPMPVPTIGQAEFTLSDDKSILTVNAVTADGKNIVVEGCTESELKSGETAKLTATGAKVILKGDIIKLNCGGNVNLTGLDVSGLTNLRELDCNENMLTKLHVQGLASLQKLECYKNKLTELNVQGLASLEKLLCNENKLSELDVKGFKALTCLNFEVNEIFKVDLQGLANLKELHCSINKLSELNVQDLVNLESLNCFGNKLGELNVQGLTNLKTLYCAYNNLTNINVQGLINLKFLGCENNKLDASVFKKIFEDLPKRGVVDDAQCLLYTEQKGVEEHNNKDFDRPEELKKAFYEAKSNKSWKMYKKDEKGRVVEIRI